MPRLPRPVLPEVPLHIIQRGNNRQQCFMGDSDYLVYLDLLKTYAHESRCKVHAYVMMTNHVHLLVTPATADGPAKMMKALGQRYVPYVNRRYARTGSLWEGRYKSCLVQHERYLLTCQRYIELNPVRAQMVEHPAHYRWSSYRVNAHGDSSDLISQHFLYRALAPDPTARELAYRKLFDVVLTTSILNKVRRATNGNYALGNRQFAREMEDALGRPVLPRRGGRPARR